MADLYTGSILTNTELIWATFQHPQMLRTRFILRARVYCSLKMVMSTKVSGNVVSSTAMVLFNMQRARRKMMKNAWDSQNSKGPTKMANDRRELWNMKMGTLTSVLLMQKAWKNAAFKNMRMEMSILVNSKTGAGFLALWDSWRESLTVGIGKTVCSMGLERSSTIMALNTKANSKTAINTGKGSWFCHQKKKTASRSMADSI